MLLNALVIFCYLKNIHTKTSWHKATSQSLQVRCLYTSWLDSLLQGLLRHVVTTLAGAVTSSEGTTRVLPPPLLAAASLQLLEDCWIKGLSSFLAIVIVHTYHAGLSTSSSQCQLACDILQHIWDICSICRLVLLKWVFTVFFFPLWIKFFLIIFIIFLNFILFLNFTMLYYFCQTSRWIRHRYTCAPHPECFTMLCWFLLYNNGNWP